MDRPVDFRSDTLTQPTDAMREAMARAPVGDDVFGEDPTVNALQDRAAELLGKEAALYVPSGTMANLLAILSQTRPGDEVILGAGTHPFNYEGGGGSAVAGVQFHPLIEEGACYTPEQFQARIRPPDAHFAPVTLALVENTHNRGGGRIVDPERIARIQAVARENEVRTHLDGARLMNAVVATGRSAADWSAGFDTVSLCFSKGLGAPVGSVLAGPSDLLQRAHRFRKRLGGGMRQAGILAAAAIHALDHHVERLADDHARAARVIAALKAHDHVEVEPGETNIVIFTARAPLPDAATLVARMEGRGVRALPVAPRSVRLVFHLDVSEAQTDHAIAVLNEVLASAN